MATGDIWRLAFSGLTIAQQYVNIWHVRFKTESATPAGAKAYIDTNFYQLMKANGTGTSWGVGVCSGRRLSVPQLTYEGTLSAAGQTAGDMLPPQNALVVSLRTGIAGRARRGRLYLGGFLESKQLDGGWDQTMVNAYQQYFDDIVAAIGSGGSNADYEWGVWSRTLGGDDPGPYDLAAGFRPITETVVRNVVYTQRRRTIGVGA